jgi:hypothetical protein
VGEDGAHRTRRPMRSHELRPVWPMLRFMPLGCAAILIAGIETMHIRKKPWLVGFKDHAPSVADPFY